VVTGAIVPHAARFPTLHSARRRGRVVSAMRVSFGHGRIAALLAGVLLALVAPATASAISTFTVNRIADTADANTGDTLCDIDTGTAGDQCTLRAAIQQSNASGGADTIAFALPSSTIGLTADLPPIKDGVTIDGYTQTGSLANTNAGFTAWNGVLTVNVDGNGFATFVVESGSTTIKGLRIYDSGSDGIRLNGGGSNKIEGNSIGTAEVDTFTERNIGAGVAVFDGDDNVIGGTAAAQRNVISGNGEPNNFNFAIPPYGVWVRGDADGTLVEGNLIGTNAAGTGDLGNGVSGVRVGGFTSGDNPCRSGRPPAVA
jgi:CSLREA domain-containing protein